MLRALRGTVEQVRDLLGAFEPERLAGADARAAAELFGELERLAGAGKALAARQVVVTESWRSAGAHRDAAAWLSSATGTSVGAARATLAASAQLAELPATEAALRAGELSTTQVEAVAEAATMDPASEGTLLESARHDGVRGLRRVCDRVKAAARADDAECSTKVREARSLRHWSDGPGSGRIEVRGPVDVTAKVMAALRPYERTLFESARQAGRRERPDAIAFDALALALSERSGDGNGKASSLTPDFVVRVDGRALVRGHLEQGEVCEIAGVGPIPVHVASRLLDDAFLEGVLVDGTDVTAVSHPGRTIPARLRTAVEERDRTCVVEGCEVTEHLEIDHNEPVEHGGPTALWNISRLCSGHHEYKHRHDLRLVGEGTRRRFVAAADPAYLRELRRWM